MANKVINCILNLKDKFSPGITAAAQNSRKLQRELKSLKNDISNLKSSFSGVTTAFKVGGVAIAAGAASCIKEYANFEQAMKNLQATTGVSNDEYKKLWDTAKNLGATTSFSCQQASEAMNYLGMAGFKTNQIIGAMPSLLDLAAASGSDLALVSDIVSDGLGAFHLMQGDIAENTKMFSDVLAKTASSANTTVDLMGESFKYCASTAGALGYSVQDTAVVLGMMGNEFTKGGSAGNALKNALVNLAKPTDQMKEVMDEYKLSLTNTDGSMKSLADVVKMLRSKFGGLDNDIQAAKVAALFGKEAMAPWLTVINTAEDSFTGLTEAIYESKDAAKQMAAIKLDTITGQFELLKSAISAMQIDIGEKLAPYTRDFVVWITEKIPKISDKLVNLASIFTSNLPQIISLVKKLAIVWLTFKGISLSMKIGSVFASIITIGGKTFGIVKSIATGAKGIGTVFGLITNPIGMALSAIVLLAGGITLLYAKEGRLDELKDKFENIGKTIKDLVKNNMPLIATVAGALSGLLAFKMLKPFSAGINVFGGTLGKSIIKILSFKNILSSIKGIPGTLLAPFNALKNGIVGLQRTFVLAKAFLPNILSFNKIGTVFKALLNPIGLLKNGFMLIKTAVLAVVSPFGIVIAIIAALAAGFIYCWNTNSQFKEKMISAWNTIAPAIGSIVNIVIGWISGLVSFLTSFYEGHKSQISTFMSAVFNTIGVVIEMIVSTIQGIVGVISGVFDVIDGLIHGNWSQMWEGCKTIFKSSIDTIIEWWNGLKEIFKHPLKAMINVFKKDSGSDSEGSTESVNVDANATGTHFFGGGWTKMNERGGELAYLPGGSAIVPADKTDKILNGGSGINVQVTIQGNVIGNESFADYVGGHVVNKVMTVLATNK
ncbi:phage tail tape measure protein [Clostridium butyricum]|uniref:Phage tail tape measure protein, TP901 family n=1 Tax=Clostridium butyricum E4 str. BoNT E BL5262 TaxID=632245 RepID=C4IJL6_CLOBU|nr:phage tail tape measure protein [Clostridium butyricum]EDT74752.1 phage tail tape measure protein, family, core region domain protein [Clostridium butyricum 5521]EEP53132.1 phage tail tape measure protein, TP901 family [Clostridium butyricum E4 str. BoNT E BL5262]NFL30481.1 phage tail tape measure protein [Clostridium butyricum]NFS19436.1 phage tail tape measure protein [Clostridium butyricum]